MDYYSTKEQKNLMDYVGKTLIGKIDSWYESWLEIFQSEEEPKYTNEIKARDLYQRLSEEDKKMILSIIKEASYRIVYSILRESQESLDPSPDALYLSARKDNIVYPNIATESDGLCGEMVLDDGWYEMFSRYFEMDDRLWWK